jgi:nitroreductase
MEIAEAIKARKSIRAFLPRPVPKQVLEEILELAARSPSWGNTQPWEVTIIAGGVMEQVKEALLQEARSAVVPDPDIPYPSFGELYRSRSRDLGSRLYQLLGISREDKQRRQEWGLQTSKFYDAPNALVFYLDEELGPWSLLDLGLFTQSVMLAALAFDLGSCSLAAVAGYPQVLRRILGIPDNKKIVCGMAIGYPDWQHPATKLESPREPVSSFTQWHGF